MIKIQWSSKTQTLQQLIDERIDKTEHDLFDVLLEKESALARESTLKKRLKRLKKAQKEFEPTPSMP